MVVDTTIIILLRTFCYHTPIWIYPDAHRIGGSIIVWLFLHKDGGHGGLFYNLIIATVIVIKQGVTVYSNVPTLPGLARDPGCWSLDTGS